MGVPDAKRLKKLEFESDRLKRLLVDAAFDNAAKTCGGRLIGTFCEVTGVPMALNTSLNENEPMVCRPQKALDCFLHTRMNVLLLGDRIIGRNA